MFKALKHTSLTHQSCFTYGQGLSEYSLIAALVGIASIGALILLGQNLHWGFTSMVPAPSSVVASAPAGSPQPLSPDMPGATGQTATGQGLTLQISLQSGTKIMVPNYQNNVKQSILTLGANGTTTKLLAVLENLTQELLAKGEITEEQASALRDLANRGHEMAEREKWVEDYLKSNNRPQQGEPVIYKGKTYGDLGEFAQTFDIFTHGNKSETQADFDKAYQEALASSSLQDPAIRAVVDSLVQEISSVADMFGEGTFMFVKHPDRYPTYDSLLEYSASKLTDENSAGICKTGNRKDSGIQCH